MGISSTYIPIIACCELLPKRARLLDKLSPNASVFCGDIREIWRDMVDAMRSKMGPTWRPFIVTASPPCQGMSSNGLGRIRSQVRTGVRPFEDQRNQLISPALEVVLRLQPDWVVIENVKAMRTTKIRSGGGEMENAVVVIKKTLRNYEVQDQVLNAADYGVPQHRERLIIICRRRGPDEDENNGQHSCDNDEDRILYHPSPTHQCRDHISINKATMHLAPLDAIHHREDPSCYSGLHRVPAWRQDQHFWMSHTDEGKSAMENDICVNCGHTQTDSKGRHLTSCEACQSTLPRPQIIQKGCPHPRLVKAFKTSYKRMHGSAPASTLTTNSGVISSDIKGHPTQNRVLSLLEVLIASSMCEFPGGPSCTWHDRVLDVFSGLGDDRLIREVCGEGICPLMMSHIARRILKLSS